MPLLDFVVPESMNPMPLLDSGTALLDSDLPESMKQNPLLDFVVPESMNRMPLLDIQLMKLRRWDW